jgi:hypothetical protein
MFDSANLSADAALASALRVGQSVSICFTLAIAGCSLALWNKDVCEAERCLSILREHATQAKSAFWLQYVNVFEVGLRAIQEPHDAECFRAAAQTQKWDFRHWENFSLLGEGFAPPELVARAKQDSEWWCSAEILRLEAHRIRRESPETNGDQADVLLRQALAAAQKQGALAWELRLAMSIFEFSRSSDDKRKARTLLSTTLNDFSEGFDSRLVQHAEALLERTSRFE